ncbi:hypothetical protein ES319_D11G175200v1 [Gossypium barbadense]|uniref:RNase H type-1 domain-containing protein n=1 Tax=Gossypium barbadense TaxID=3634 RepID=A0A5J5PEL3_GOSBA|nr:hypothetical protein ES319_D11G175200v1 [Gossypium barbadense]
MCCDVNWTGVQKSLWLIAILASCWTVWLARNDKVFDRTLINLDTMLYHSKMRALMWARAVLDECQFLECYWWYWPAKCSSSRSMLSRTEDVAGCGGVLRDNKGVACALFSGQILARGSGMTKLMAFKGVVEMYIGLNRKAHLLNLFENINYGTRQVAGFQVAVTHRQSNGMADVLAKADISRSSFFKVSW